jgi:Ca2+-binding RTX toxin-like protein
VATFTAGAGQAIDFGNFDVTDLTGGTPTAMPTATKFRYETSDTEFREFTGTFNYPSGVWTGTITGILVVDPPGTTTYQITGMSMPVGNFLNFVNTSDSDGFLASAFKGDDLFNSAAGSFADNIDGFAGNDTIIANGGDDTINGGVGNDSLLGGDGDDLLQGGDGNDTLDGGTSGTGDFMTGGAGNDTYFLDTASDDVDEGVGSGVDTVIVSIDDYNLLDAIGVVENLTLASGAGIVTGTGSDFENKIVGNENDNKLFGLASADTLIGGLGNDSLDAGTGLDSLAGDGGNDTLLGQADRDMLAGGDGDDLLDGGTGNDTMAGGTGNDVYQVDHFLDVVTELMAAGTDEVFSKIDFTLGPNLENLTLLAAATKGIGNTLDNRLIGTDNANFLDGLTGADTMLGKGGDDTYVVDSALDIVDESVGGSGTDVVQSSVTYNLNDGSGQTLGDVEHLLLTGKATIDGIGNKLANSITGNIARNNLTGDDGADTLDGGVNADTMIGGNGSDLYFVDSIGDIIQETGAELDDAVNSKLSIDLSLAKFDGLEHVTLLGTAALFAFGDDADNKLIGNLGANKIKGNAGSDTIDGGGSQDSLEGNSENDSIDGGLGNDTLDGGTGDDTLRGGDGSDTYRIDSAGDKFEELTGGLLGGTDLVISTVEATTLGANLEHLTMLDGAKDGTGNDLNNQILGNAADNSLSGGSDGSDTLVGGLGKDTLDGGTLGKDVMAGGADSDLYSADDGDRVIETVAGVAGGVDVVQYFGSKGFILGANLENLQILSIGDVFGFGNALSNEIIGGLGKNSLAGGVGNDTISGADGNDTVDGGKGIDSLAGGKGDDRYVVDNGKDIVDESSGDGSDTVISAVSFDLNANGTTVLGDLESLTLVGAGKISGTGNALANVITGNSGANTIDGGSESDTLSGGAGNDSLNGGTGIFADKLDGGAGIDIMDGGDGDDTYTVDNAADKVVELALADSGANDAVQASVNCILAANVEHLTLIGNALIGFGNELDNTVTGTGKSNRLLGLVGSDTITGLEGNDTLDGGAGSDSLLGGVGNDLYQVDSAADVADETGGSGTDTVLATVTYSLTANALGDIENLTLAAKSGSIAGDGNALANSILGNEGANALNGFDGNDTLNGGVGEDTLTGGIGDDRIIGGLGADVIIYADTLSGHDLVLGFDGNTAGGQDKLDLDALFDSLNIDTAARSKLVDIDPNGATVDVKVDADQIGSFELHVATLQTADLITIGEDVVVGTL